jgi:hypothetical protein
MNELEYWDGVFNLIQETLKPKEPVESCPFCGKEYPDLDETGYINCECGHCIKVVYREDYNALIILPYGYN